MLITDTYKIIWEWSWSIRNYLLGWRFKVSQLLLIELIVPSHMFTAYLFLEFNIGYTSKSVVYG